MILLKLFSICGSQNKIFSISALHDLCWLTILGLKRLFASVPT